MIELEIYPCCEECDVCPYFMPEYGGCQNPVFDFDEVLS